jgi:hypothetical protein
VQLHCTVVGMFMRWQISRAAWALTQELGEGPRRGGSGSGGGRGPSGVGATISRMVVGTLSLWLRAHEAGANAVDRTVSCLDIGQSAADSSFPCGHHLLTAHWRDVAELSGCQGHRCRRRRLKE